MIITIPVLAILAVLFILPNYVAVRYALLGDVLVGGKAPVRRRRKTAAAERADAGTASERRPMHLWKAFSPLLFAICLILGVAIGGVPGLSLAGVALLNLLWGFTGWRGL